ncbi:secretion system protein, partial [Wolbachia endosymbiont of Atemnus politus]|nr:secretion system protein [Wolbachia endosymbiont of Atemnus politus]
MSLSGNDEPAVPEIVPLPIKFPDLTASSQLISINISEEVPVKDLLIEKGKLSDINLDIDPKISGNIILKLKDKNINEVIQSIADSAKLRCSTSNDVIRIEQDLPYAQNYYVDFINIQHSAQSSFAVNNNITSSNVDKDYNSVMKYQYSSDLWNSLEKGLNAIMDVNGVDDGEFLSSNREAGVIILNARKNIHRAVEEYINKVKQLASSQVMIEAKIVEVVLGDKYLSGINLNDLRDEIKSAMNQDNSIINLAMNQDNSIIN